MLKFLLLPLALLFGAFGLMTTHIMASAFHHRLAWEQTTATLVSAERRCRVTFQPADQVLRQDAWVGPCEEADGVALPAGGSKPRLFEDIYGTVRYEAAGATRDWQGKLADIGVYTQEAGSRLAVFYDPADPSRLDTAAMKGWFGGVLILAASLAFLGFYGWFFWLRRA